MVLVWLELRKLEIQARINYFKSNKKFLYKEKRDQKGGTDKVLRYKFYKNFILFNLIFYSD